MGKAINTCCDNMGYFNPPNVYRPAIIDIRIVGEYSAEDGATNTYRITQNDGKIFEFDVKNGSGGSAGRSVTSVEQIQISTESLGKNIARINLSDGTYTDVEIRNGAQGQTGPQGERGPAGIDQVEATVDATTGTPSVHTSIVDGKLNIAFSGIKGETGKKGDQGNTGSSVDYPYELVNNVTTDDATKGLSAAQGVVLNDRIEQGDRNALEEYGGDFQRLNGFTYPTKIGGINGSTGAVTTSTSRLRTLVFIDNTSPVDIRISGGLLLLNYNTYNTPSFDDFVEQIDAPTTLYFGGRFTIGKYLILVLHRADNADITPQDIANTKIEVVNVKTSLTDLDDKVDALATSVGSSPLGRFVVASIDSSTGDLVYYATSRIASSFIDGRDNDIIVNCSGNIVLYVVYKYATNSGAPTASVTINNASITLSKSGYGCWMRLLFKRTDDSACSESDFQYISIQSSGQAAELPVIKTDISEIQKSDTPYSRPWDAIADHNGILLNTVMKVQGFAGNTHKVIPVNGGETLTIKANNSYIARCAIVKTYTEPAATGDTPFDFASGEPQRRDIAIGTTATINIPSDARFVIVSSLMGSASANAEPSSLQIDGYDVILGERKEIGIIKEDMQELQDRVFIDTTLEQGGINDNTGATTSSSSRVRTKMLDGAFLIRVNEGYLINQVYKWSKAGAYIGAVEDDVPIGKSYEMEDSGFMYRVVMRKADNTDLFPTDDVVLELSVGLDYEYSRNIYGFTRAALSSEVEGKIVPFVRGTDEDRMSYDDSKKYERLVIGFMTDNHIDLGDKQASYNNVKDAIDFYNHLHIPVAAILEGGDAITKIVDTKALQIAHLERFFDMTWKAKMPCLFTKGNHDINTINVPPSLVLDDDDWGEVWFNRAETQYGIVRQTKASGKKSGYYYYDLDAWKVRIICVDCFDLDFTKVDGSGNVLYSGGAANWIAQEQYDWIANTALNFDDKAEKDWGVIVFMHYYRTYDEYGTDIEPKFTNPYRLFNDMLVAFNSQTDYEEVYSFPDNTFFNLNVSANFSRYANLEKKPYFISLITGHRHFDGNEVLDGINNILTANQLCGENSADIRLKRVAHTKTQNLFDTFVIDLKARTIRAFRFGAGVTCYGNGGDRFLPNGLSF